MPDHSRNGPEQVLVVGPAWVGDMVMAQTLYKTLRRLHPEVAIDVVAPAWSEPLLARMREVRHAIPLPVGHGQLRLRERIRIGRGLRTRGYDRAIVLPRSLKSALIPAAARIPVRTGYLGEWRYGLLNDIRPLDKGAMPKMVQRYVALAAEKGATPAEEIPQPRLEVDEINRGALLRRLGLKLDRPVAGFMPGAEYGPAKRWPPRLFAQLAQRLVGEGMQVWIFGSEKERALGEQIAAGRPDVINLCGATSLVDAVDLISLAAVVVTNDSGLMHVAAALDRPLVAIYGSSTPTYTPPLTERAHIEYLGLECSPCFERTCPRGDYACLQEIDPQRVFEAVSASAAGAGR